MSDSVQTTSSGDDVCWEVYTLGENPIVIEEDVPWDRLIQSVGQNGGWFKVNDGLLINPDNVTRIQRIRKSDLIPDVVRR